MPPPCSHAGMLPAVSAGCQPPPHGFSCSLDWQGTREITRTLVRRVEIDGEHIEVVFRVPPSADDDSSTRPEPMGVNPPCWEDSPGGRRADLRPARALSAPAGRPRGQYRDVTGHDLAGGALRDRRPVRAADHGVSSRHGSYYYRVRS